MRIELKASARRCSRAEADFSAAFSIRREARNRPAPGRTALHSCRPNPFNPATVIGFDIARAGPIDLRIYDTRGALVRILRRGVAEVGSYEVGWDGRHHDGSRAASGIYFYRLQAADFDATRKMVLIR